MRIFSTFWRAVLIGIANIIPGVSSGTIAYISGIYFPVLEAISTLTGRSKPKWTALLYLAVVGAGVGLGVVATSMLLSVIFEVYVAEITLFFAGLVAGSIPWLIRKAHLDAKIAPKYIMLMCGIAILVCVFSYYALKITSVSGTIAMSGWVRNGYIVLIAFVAGMVMGIPGISGSFVLLIAGVYDILLTAVRESDLFVIALLLIGSIVAVVFFAHSMLALLKRHEAAVQWGIIGAVIGSSLGLILAYLSAVPYFMLITLFVLGCAGGWLFTLIGTANTKA